jgi:hypothetical protein
MSYEKDKDAVIKLSKFKKKITGILSQVLTSSKAQKQTRFQIYNTLAIPTLVYSSETWTLKEQGKARIMAAEKKFWRKSAKYTLRPQKESRYHKETQNRTQPVLEKPTVKLNGYNMFAEWTVFDSGKLSRNTNQ